MNSKNQTRYLRPGKKKLLWITRNIPLWVIVIVPFLLNIGITFGLIERFSGSRNQQIAENIAKQAQNKIGERVFLRLNKYANKKDTNLSGFKQDLKQVLQQIDLPIAAKVLIVKNSESVIISNIQQQDKILSLWQRLLPNIKDINQTQLINLVIEQQEYFVQKIPWQNQSLESGWSVIVAIPKSELMSYVAQKPNKQTREYLAYLLPTVLLGLFTYVGIAHLLERLNKTGVAIAQGNPDLELEDIPLAKLNTFNQSLRQITRQQKAIQPKGKAGNNSVTNSLLADLSHELRSPLNAILGFAQIMQQESSMTRLQQENMAIINHSGKRMLSIINDLVDLSKIEIDRLVLEENSFDFYFWLDNIEEIFKKKAHSQGLEIVTLRDSQLPRYICADEARLRQILTNVIDYCLSHTKAELITVRVGCQVIHSPTNTSKEPNLYFTVENTDCFLTSLELLTLFNPAVSVRHQKNLHNNSPLSLPLSRQLAQLMGGDINVERSDMPEGITFRLDIEAEIVTNQAVEIQSTAKKVISLESKQPNYRILVVDDSKTNRKIMVQLLEKVGFEIQEAANGKEAVDIWLGWRPHMIWMDIQMPVMNGYEATEQIKSYPQSKSPAIVAISASNLELERSQFLASGCDDFVGKPFSEDIILDKIAQHLGVRYVYQSMPRSSSSIKLTADALTVMSPQWLSEIEQAAITLDAALLTQLLQEIPPRHSSLQNALQRQVNNFDFDKILNLVGQSKSK